MIFKINFNTQTHVIRFEKQTNFLSLIAYIQSSFKRLPKKFTLTYIDEEKDEVSLDNDFDLENLVSLEMNKVLIKIVEVNEDFEEENGIKKSEKIETFIKEENEFHLRKSSSNDESSIDSDEEKSIDLTKIEPQNETHPDIFKGEQSEEQQKEKIEEYEKIEKNENEEESVHENVQCAHCGAQPLVGIRYKCSICINFDLCQNCEATFNHQHAMLKIKHSNQEFSHREESMQYALLKIANKGVQKVKNGYEVVLKVVKDTFNSKDEEGNSMNEKKDLDEMGKKEVSGEKYEGISNENKDKMVEKASYLSCMLNIELKQGYCFVEAHPELDNEELVTEYLKDENLGKND